MSIELSIDFNEPRIAAFLADVNGVDFVERPPAPEGFSEVGRRENERDVERFPALFGLRELYRLEMNGSSAGVVSADVIMQQGLRVWVEYVVYGRSDLSADQRQRLEALLGLHDEQQPPDLEAWLVDQIRDGWILREQIVIAGHLHLRKRGNAQDVNASQRDVLFALYGQQGNRPPRSRIELLPEDGFTRWAEARNSRLVLIGSEPITQGIARDATVSAEIPASPQPGEAADAAIDGLLDEATRVLVPNRCVGFRRINQRMVSVAGWPEFKIEWQFRTIRVGCARIKVPVPIMRTRISNLVCFLYYHLPEQADQAVFEILKACAIRSALTGAVVGIVLGNPAAAIQTFKANFTSCLKDESFACLTPGLFLVKEAGAWH
jgi:hypothetical protein